MYAGPGPRELGVGEVARRKGIHRETARRWLKDLELRYGTAIVYRRCGRLYTTDVALMKVSPPNPDPRLAREVAELRKRVAELEKRDDAHARELLEFRRQARDWLMRGVKRIATEGGHSSR